MRLRLLALLALFAQVLIGFAGSAPATAATLDSVFFSEGFESGAFGASWTPSVTNNGVADVNSNYPHGGSKSAFLGQNVAGNASAFLVLAFDATGKTDIFLDFWSRAVGGYPYGTTRTMSISDNGGNTWKQIIDLTAASSNFSHHMIDVSSVAAANGLTLNSQFRIGFYYAGYGISNGLVIDDIRLTQRAQEILSFPVAQDSFETTSLQQGLYPQSWYGGVAEISPSYPHNGTKSVFLGQKVAGNASAYLVLALDLSGQSDVFLDFWSRATGGAPYGTSRAVSISDNAGSTWTQISDLTAASQTFSHHVFDISSLAATNGLTLNNQFYIVFGYVGSGASNGLVIDDLRLTKRAQAITSFPFTETFESGDVSQGLYTQSAVSGVTEINANYPHSGTKSIFIGQKTPGSAAAVLRMALDLTGQTDVLLDFWSRAVGSSPYGTARTISISDNGGSTWKQVLDLTAAPQSFSHQSLNIASLAEANGLALNDQFRIDFYYAGFGTNNGLVIDDIKLIRTSLSGKVYNEAATAGSEVAGAYVEVCSASNVCQMITTGSDGSYAFGDLAAGKYTLRALPPANNTHMIGTLGPVTLTANGPLANQNILLPKAAGPPTGTTVTPVVATIGGVPSVFWKTAVTISQQGCTGGTATYSVMSGGATVRSGRLTESPAGTYSAQIAPLFPLHGTAQIEVDITCTTGAQPPIVFNIWIDPSGLVVDTNGKPISDATVTLYRSDATSLADATASSFAAVPTGSGIMSPANRVNPMTSDANGAFGWDVIAGYYKVRAEKAGCSIPGGSQAYNETAVLSIPPPVTDLRVTLYCGETQQFSVYLPLIRR